MWRRRPSLPEIQRATADCPPTPSSWAPCNGFVGDQSSEIKDQTSENDEPMASGADAACGLQLLLGDATRGDTLQQEGNVIIIFPFPPPIDSSPLHNRLGASLNEPEFREREGDESNSISPKGS